MTLDKINLRLLSEIKNLHSPDLKDEFDVQVKKEQMKDGFDFTEGGFENKNEEAEEEQVQEQKPAFDLT